MDRVFSLDLAMDPVFGDWLRTPYLATEPYLANIAGWPGWLVIWLFYFILVADCWLGWLGWVVTWLCYFILIGDWLEIGGGWMAGWLPGYLVVYLAIHTVFSHGPCI